MKVVGLISGGKDSSYNLLQCIAAGHDVVALANLAPGCVDELDSYMYQSVGHMGVSIYADAMGLPLFRRVIEGTSLNTHSIDYSPTDGDEVEDLYSLLKQVKDECDVEAVSVGAVLSDYQRVRVENVCQRLGLLSLAYLWRRDQSELLQEMIDCGFEAVIIKVAAIGLVPLSHLGKTIKEMQPHLEKMKEKYKLNVCGEGGEYETFTLDCPLFRKRIVICDKEVVELSGDVGYLNFKSLRLEDKKLPQYLSQTDIIASLNVKNPYAFLLDLRLKEEEQQAEDQAKENTLQEDSSDISNCDYKRLKSPSTTLLEDEIPLAYFSSGYLWTSVYSSSVHDAMNKLKKVLEERGLTLQNLVSVKMFIRNMEDYALYNADYIQYFSTAPPTRACVEIPLDGEIGLCMDVVGWKNPHAGGAVNNADTLTQKTLHVQSISHWAPANIGPYSQAVQIGKLIMIAGMIGLIPGTLELMSGGVELQSRLALRHVCRVLAAMNSKANVRSVVQGVCYLTNLSDVAVARRMMARVSESQITAYVVVPSLPKSALVEWHMWAHLENDKFDYEERGFTRDSVNVLLRRRISCDHSVCALIATASCQNADDVTEDVLREMFHYSVQKMEPGEESENMSISMTVYYKSSALCSDRILNSMKMCSPVISRSVVPVIALENKSTVITLVLVRH